MWKKKRIENGCVSFAFKYRLALSSQVAVLNWSIEVFSKKYRPRLANSFWILASQVIYFLQYLVNTHNQRE